jgi:hypothetical protein
MSKSVTSAVAAVMMIAAAAAQPAQAKEHPRVAGLSCSALARSMGAGNVWQTYFYGEQLLGINHRFVYSEAPCFRTEVDCRNWLYWAQTDWPREQDVRWCHRGIR